MTEREVELKGKMQKIALEAEAQAVEAPNIEEKWCELAEMWMDVMEKTEERVAKSFGQKKETV